MSPPTKRPRPISKFRHAVSASSTAAQNLKFERADWTIFRTVEGLAAEGRRAAGQAAPTGAEGAGRQRPRRRRRGQRRRAAQRAATSSRTTAPASTARRKRSPGCSRIARPMVSTKLLRLPTRGALGNGLRVVAGAVLASGGSLVVITRNRRIELRPERDGTTTVVSVKRSSVRSAPASRSASARRCRRTTTRSIWAQAAPAAGADRNDLRRQVVAVVVRRCRNSTSCSTPAATGRCASWSPTSTAALAPRLARSSPQPGSAARSAATSPAQQAEKLLMVAREQCQAGEPEAARCRRSRCLRR